jgi:hypothetical protein
MWLWLVGVAVALVAVVLVGIGQMFLVKTLVVVLVLRRRLAFWLEPMRSRLVVAVRLRQMGLHRFLVLSQQLAVVTVVR